ncbi:MAG TPA: methyltransferase [Caulobacteraceae bacterium]
MALTDDHILDGRIRLRQRREGYRAGLDAALLAAACDARPGDRVLDAGCGVGAVMLAAAARIAGASFVGVENDPAALDLARANIAANGVADRVLVVAGDVDQPFSRAGLAPFDAALANPPFFDDPSALRGPSPAKRAAWIAGQGLGSWAAFLLKAVRQGGSITVIHRADRLAEILALLASGAGSFQIRPVQPFADAPAKRVLVRAIKSGKAPLQILPALTLHPPNEAKHTALTEAVLRGREALAWT